MDDNYQTLVELLEETKKRLNAFDSLIWHAPAELAEWTLCGRDEWSSGHMILFHNRPTEGRTTLESAKAVAKAVRGKWTRDNSGSWSGKLAGMTITLIGVESAIPSKDIEL